MKIVNKLKKFKVTNSLSMKIGIHTGNAIAGIVGTKIARYDIYGKYVDISNLVESSGLPARVNISSTTKEVLESVF